MMLVFRRLMIFAAFFTLVASSSALAEVRWYLEATFSDGGTAKGYFSISQYYAVDYNIQTTANGDFDAYEFLPTTTGVAGPVISPTDVLIFGPSYSGDQLRLYSENPLDVAGPNALLTSSYECMTSYSCPASPAGDTRYVTSAILSNGAVPEPAIWGFLLLGFGAIGARARHRRHLAAAPSRRLR
jgi:hypothetical protein